MYSIKRLHAAHTRPESLWYLYGFRMSDLPMRPARRELAAIVMFEQKKSAVPKINFHSHAWHAAAAAASLQPQRLSPLWGCLYACL